MDFEKLREEEFPATESWAYLNAASLGLVPCRVATSMKSQLDHATYVGLSQDFSTRVYGFADKLREKIASFIGASPEEIALVRNTSEGISIVANGFGLAQGDNVIINDMEFPANVYPWLALAERNGVEVRFVKQRNRKVLLDDIEKLIDNKTKIVSISSVQFGNGFRVDLNELGRLCAEHGVHLVVDAIQSLGVLPMDVRRFNISALSAGCYKWLMVPDGIGILFVEKSLLGKLEVVNVGWWNVTDERNFFDYHLTFKEDARRFHISHPSITGIYGLDAVLDLISKIGIENIERRVLYLSSILVDGLKKLPAKLLTPTDDINCQSGIVTFDVANREQIAQQLSRRNIVVTIRTDGIRVSPHFYNNEADIEKLLETLGALLG